MRMRSPLSYFVFSALALILTVNINPSRGVLPAGSLAFQSCHADIISVENIPPGFIIESSSENVRYRILRKLGEGGLGVVYEAEKLNRFHHIVQGKVALKFYVKSVDHQMITRSLKELYKDQSQDNAINQHFMSQEPAQEISIPALGGVYKVSEMNLIPWSISQKASEFSLLMGPDRTIAADHQIGMRIWRLAKVMQDLDRAISILHRKGLVHGDIKLANIGLIAPATDSSIGAFDNRYHMGLLDYDSLRVKGEDTQKLLMTPRYVQPEVLANPLKAGISSDRYASMLSMYQLITGEVEKYVGDAGKHAKRISDYYDLMEEVHDGLGSVQEILGEKLKDGVITQKEYSLFDFMKRRILSGLKQTAQTQEISNVQYFRDHQRRYSARGKIDIVFQKDGTPVLGPQPLVIPPEVVEWSQKPGARVTHPLKMDAPFKGAGSQSDEETQVSKSLGCAERLGSLGLGLGNKP